MISIQSVYQTTLFISNIFQRGLVTPEQFNRYAKQTQIEIYEQYFSKLAEAAVSFGPMEPEYNNISDHIFEKLEDFEVRDTLTSTNGTFNLRSLDEPLHRLSTIRAVGETSNPGSFNTTLSATAPATTLPEMISITIPPPTGVAADVIRATGLLVDGIELSFTTNNNVVTFASTQRINGNSVELEVGDAVVISYTYPTFNAQARTADLIDKKEIQYVIDSPLTSPTAQQPVYVRVGQNINMYPSTVSRIQVDYIKALSNDPNWVGAISNGQLIPAYTGSNLRDEASGFTNFELHYSEEPTVVAKILSYIGIEISNTEVLQFGELLNQRTDGNTVV